MVHTKRSLFCMVCLGFALAAKAVEPSPSPSADTELICPTNNAIECYPKIFQPTKDFQAIREGQEIPPGLHVRMNINDGTKEARLNIPMEGELGAEYKGIPVEQAMVVVEDQPTEELNVEENLMEEIEKAMRDHVYEEAGKIQQPLSNGDDFENFQKALLAITMEAGAFDKALDDLSELSHDAYYGVEIAKSGLVLEKLVCLTLGSGTEKFPAKEQKRDQKAGAILASSIQNNPTALKEIADMYRIVMYPNCHVDVTEPQKKGTNNFVGIMRSRLGKERDPSALKSKIKVVSGLIKDSTIRREFMGMKGMEMLLEIWLRKGKQWDSVREKVAQLVMDNFLDEGMGAELGIWPKTAISSSSICETKGSVLGDGCWEHHIGSFSKANPQASWAEDFLKSLEAQRPKEKHTEL